jgi:hypothetical protein
VYRRFCFDAVPSTGYLGLKVTDPEAATRVEKFSAL